MLDRNRSIILPLLVLLGLLAPPAPALASEAVGEAAAESHLQDSGSSPWGHDASNHDAARESMVVGSGEVLDASVEFEEDASALHADVRHVESSVPMRAATRVVAAATSLITNSPRSPPAD